MSTRSSQIALCAATLLACFVAHSGQQAIWLHEQELPRNTSAQLEGLLGRVGPNMRASTNYQDYQDVGLNESLDAWKLLHKQAKQVAQHQVQLQRAPLAKLLGASNVSSPCLASVNQMLDSINEFESWAMQMWSASGNFPPVGFIDGHLTDVGSYRGCLDITVPPGSNFTHTSYCMIAVRPLLPVRPRFHSVFKKLDRSLVELYEDKDFLHAVSLHAHYFYYLFLKTGICVPSSCTPGDIQSAVNVVAHRFALAPGPVKCITRALPSGDQALAPYLRHETDQFKSGQIENEPILIRLNRPINRAQMISLALVASFFALVFLATGWHALETITSNIRDDYEQTKATKVAPNESSTKEAKLITLNHSDATGDNVLTFSEPMPTPDPKKRRQSIMVSRSHGIKYVAFHYFSILTNGYEFLNTSLRNNEIRCLHGFRVLTMLWIICVHTLQYNDWSGFTRVFTVESSFKDPMMQPMINANHVVDNFFLMSGLLAAYTTWFANKGSADNYSIGTSLLARYLRLTPQVLLVSLLYILLPLVGEGPFWYDMTHDAAKTCEKNWWINLLHLQAFYRDNEMCNLVGWWISVDMYYYLIAVVILWMILDRKLKRALVCSLAFVTFCTVATIYRHYTHGLTPNNLGSVPQIGEVWSEYVVHFNWSPYPHGYVFFLGLWLGYVLANNKWKDQVKRWSTPCWFLSLLSLAVVNVSSHIWVSGAYEPNNQLVSTAYNVICTILWANAFGWIIVALHYGCLPYVSRVLSSDICVLLSKASFIIYLSHMLLLRVVFGSQYTTIEVSTGHLVFLMVGNIFASVIFGIFLCVTFEGPCMKLQRWIIAQVKPIKRAPSSTAMPSSKFNHSTNEQEEKMSLKGGPTKMVLLK